MYNNKNEFNNNIIKILESLASSHEAISESLSRMEESVEYLANSHKSSCCRAKYLNTSTKYNRRITDINYIGEDSNDDDE